MSINFLFCHDLHVVPQECTLQSIENKFSSIFFCQTGYFSHFSFFIHSFIHSLGLFTYTWNRINVTQWMIEFVMVFLLQINHIYFSQSSVLFFFIFRPATNLHHVCPCMCSLSSGNCTKRNERK